MNTNKEMIDAFLKVFHHQKFACVLNKVNQDFCQNNDYLQRLYQRWHHFYHVSMTEHDALTALIQVSLEMISVEEPQWEMIAARFLAYDIHQQVAKQMKLRENKIFNTGRILWQLYFRTLYFTRY